MLEISKINQQVCSQQLYYTNVLVVNKRVVDPTTFKSFPYGFYEATKLTCFVFEKSIVFIGADSFCIVNKNIFV